jgi:phosphoribosylformylglycinamidine synthase I
MKFGVMVFPGSNCDADCYHVIQNVIQQPVEYIWHQERSLAGFDCIVLPGGFSYGDYLRVGAIARFSPAMEALEKFAREGGLVLGICNGFQILVEAGLLPGALIRNQSLKFRCEPAFLRIENTDTPFTNQGFVGQVLQVPIAHGEGSYFADEATLAEIEANGQVLFRYCNAQGEVVPQANPNGSLNNIAGICNREKNILGMMPHPERCSESILGNAQGLLIFESLLHWSGRGGGCAAR